MHPDVTDLSKSRTFYGLLARNSLGDGIVPAGSTCVRPVQTWVGAPCELSCKIFILSWWLRHELIWSKRNEDNLRTQWKCWITSTIELVTAALKLDPILGVVARFKGKKTMHSAYSKSSDKIMVLRVDSTGSVYLGAVPFRNRWCCWGGPLTWPLRMISWDRRISLLLQCKIQK